MIIWKGKGLLPALAVFLSMFLAGIATEIGNIDLNSKTGAPLLFLMMTLLGSGLNAFFTKKFVSEKSRIFIDKETGQEVVVKDGSSLFFIPNKYWTYIILAIGLFATWNAFSQK